MPVNLTPIASSLMLAQLRDCTSQETHWLLDLQFQRWGSRPRCRSMNRSLESHLPKRVLASLKCTGLALHYLEVSTASSIYHRCHLRLRRNIGSEWLRRFVSKPKLLRLFELTRNLDIRLKDVWRGVAQQLAVAMSIIYINPRCPIVNCSVILPSYISLLSQTNRID